MMIELRSSNLPISGAMREHAERKLELAIGRFAPRIARITVRIVDVNGPRGGRDKRCRIIARLRPSRRVIVEATDADTYVAVSQAAARLDERLARTLSKQRVNGVSLSDRGGIAVATTKLDEPE